MRLCFVVTRHLGMACPAGPAAPTRFVTIPTCLLLLLRPLFAKVFTVNIAKMAGMAAVVSYYSGPRFVQRIPSEGGMSEPGFAQRAPSEGGFLGWGRCLPIVGNIANYKVFET